MCGESEHSISLCVCTYRDLIITVVKITAYTNVFRGVLIRWNGMVEWNSGTVEWA